MMQPDGRASIPTAAAAGGHPPRFGFARAMALVLLGALGVRCVFFVGLQGCDDLDYIHHAHALATGTYAPTAHEFALRFGLIVPMAAVEQALGAGPVTYMLPTLAASLASVLLAGLIARRFGGDRAGLLAAALVACLPVNAYAASDIHSDLPMSVWLLLAFWLLLRQGLLDSADAAPRPGDARAAALAGLAVGAAYLTKVTAFMGVLAFGALTLGRPRLRRVFPALAAGAALLVAAETLVYAAACGDPLLHVRAVRERHGGDMEAEYATSDKVRERLFVELPSKLFDPRAGDFPQLGGLFILLVTFAWAARRMPVPGRGALAVWVVAWLALLDFWPLRLSPFLPGHRLVPRVLEPATTPAAALLALHVEAVLRRAARPGRVAAVSLVALFMVGWLASLFVLQQDGRRWRATTEAVWERLQSERAPDRSAAPVLADERTTALLRVMDGFRAPDRYREYTEDALRAAGGAFIVDNRFWRRRPGRWYHWKDPLTSVSTPPSWEQVLQWDPPLRRSLRAALLGGSPAGIGGEEDRVTVYWARAK